MGFQGFSMPGLLFKFWVILKGFPFNVLFVRFLELGASGFVTDLGIHVAIATPSTTAASVHQQAIGRCRRENDRKIKWRQFACFVCINLFVLFAAFFSGYYEDHVCLLCFVCFFSWQWIYYEDSFFFRLVFSSSDNEYIMKTMFVCFVCFVSCLFWQWMS